jgi:hypothetical protein
MKPLNPEQRARFEENRDSLRVKFQPTPANICGGGIRLKLTDSYGVGEKFAMQFLIPFAKPNTIEVVGEVVWTTPVLTRSGGEPLSYVAMKFAHIDERDRESLIRFIALEQLQQIQQQRGAERTVPEAGEAGAPAGLWPRRLLVTTITVFVLAALAAWLVPILRDYYSYRRERNEIQRTFEQGVQKYRKGKDDGGF